jgi:hypothetical protein
MQQILETAAVLAALFAPIAALFAIRARAMRAFAGRRGLRYLSKQLPKSFSMDRRHFPFHGALKLRGISNVIAGEYEGKEVVIFDCFFGGGGGFHCTFIAVRTESNPFGSDTSPWKLIQSKGWIALFRTRYLQIPPWTMSIAQIEEHLNQI